MMLPQEKKERHCQRDTNREAKQSQPGPTHFEPPTLHENKNNEHNR